MSGATIYTQKNPPHWPWDCDIVPPGKPGYKAWAEISRWVYATLAEWRKQADEYRNCCTNEYWRKFLRWSTNITPFSQ